MSNGSNLLKAIPLVQTAAFVGANYKFATKKRKKASDFVKTGVGNFVGIELIKETSRFTGGSY